MRNNIKRLYFYLMMPFVCAFMVCSQKALAQDADDIIKKYGYIVVKEAPPRIMDSVAAAYQGTWKYEDKERGIEFIVKLKCVSYINMFVGKEKKPKDQLLISGTYKIVVQGTILENNLSLLNNIKDISVRTEYNSKDFYHPISGGAIFPDNLPDVADFYFKDQTTKKKSKYFYIRTDTMDSSNNRLYWDFSDTNNNWLLNEGARVMTREMIEEERRIDEAGFSVPEKCVLTRVSHSVYDD